MVQRNIDQGSSGAGNAPASSTQFNPKGNTMINAFEDIQKIGKENLDNAVKAFGAQQKGVQAIALEVADYSKKAVEAGSAQFEKLVGVKTLDKAIELQTDFAKSAYEGYVAHATKVGEMVTELAKEAAKPLEGFIAKVQAK